MDGRILFFLLITSFLLSQLYFLLLQSWVNQSHVKDDTGGTNLFYCWLPWNKPVTYSLVFCQGLWVNIAKDQLFCLLGPNGAGKTTTISCLTGVTPVTGGDGKILFECVLCFCRCTVAFTFNMTSSGMLAIKFDLLSALIYGNSIGSSVGMSKIRKIIGVCPQVILYLSE